MRGSSRSALARKRVAEGLEERRHALDVHGFVERGKGARQHQPVFQRVARARWRLGAVAQHPPAPVGPAPDIGGIDAEIAAARRFDAAHRAQIFGAAGNRRGGYRALRHQAALAIEVAQHQFQQFRALHDAGAQLLPVGLVDQERQMAQRPKPVGGLSRGAIGHAGFPQMPVGGAETPLDIGSGSGSRRHRRTGSRPRAARHPGRYIHREFRAAGHSRGPTAPRADCPDGPWFPDCLPRLLSWPSCPAIPNSPALEAHSQ